MVLKDPQFDEVLTGAFAEVPNRDELDSMLEDVVVVPVKLAQPEVHPTPR